MNLPVCSPAHSTPLHKSTLVVLLFQAVFLIAQEVGDGRYSSAMTAIFAATLAVSVANRRLLADPQGPHAATYIALWRYGVLALLGTLTVIVAARAYAPTTVPNGTPTLIVMLVSAMLALKGAALGKLKPNGVIGLRLRWTCQSQLAWEQAHRLMGRILFYGGLCALVAAPFVHVGVSLSGLAALVLTSVISGAMKARKAWLADPDRRPPS